MRYIKVQNYDTAEKANANESAARGGGAPASKPLEGRASPEGGWSLSFLPSAVLIVSVSGLKSRLPPSTMAVTISGEATNACVAGFASLRPVKLRLNEVMIVFLSPFFMSFLHAHNACGSAHAHTRIRIHIRIRDIAPL